MGDVTIVVGTYGEARWEALAKERAIPSAEGQAPVIHRHGSTLAAARNDALALVQTDLVVHLDADDELEEGYVETLSRGTADLRAPAVRYVRSRDAARPHLPRVAGHRHACSADCLDEGNWLVIGTAVRTELAKRIGWREYAIWEDWDFFRRCWKAGGSVEAIPAAIYRAYGGGRNDSLSPIERRRVFEQIAA